MLRPGHKKTPPRRAARDTGQWPRGGGAGHARRARGQSPRREPTALARECGGAEVQPQREGGRGRPFFAAFRGFGAICCGEPPGRPRAGSCRAPRKAQSAAKTGGGAGQTECRPVCAAPAATRGRRGGTSRARGAGGAACGQRARDARDAKRRPGGRRGGADGGCCPVCAAPAATRRARGGTSRARGAGGAGGAGGANADAGRGAGRKAPPRRAARHNAKRESLRGAGRGAGRARSRLPGARRGQSRLRVRLASASSRRKFTSDASAASTYVMAAARSTFFAASDSSYVT